MNWIKTLLILIVVLYVLGGLFLFLFQEKLIFRPDALPQDFQYRFDAEFDELNLEMEDGAVINGLHFKAKNPKGLILYFHGNAGELSRWGEVVVPFLEYNYDVLIIDYRGYGKSTGKRSKKSMLEDAEAVYAQAAVLYPQNQITVYGRSLGCSFATHVAAEFSPKQVILESPFYSVADVASSFAWMYPVNRMVRFNFRNDRNLKEVECPVTIVHGSDDLVVPIESGRKLEAVSNNVKFHEIDGGGHNDLAGFKVYWDLMDQLLK